LPALQVGEDGRQVAGPLEHRPGGGADADLELVRDHVRERGLAEAGGAVEQDVVEDVAARPRGRDLHAEVLADGLLPDVLVQRARAERGLDRDLVLERLGLDRAPHPESPWSAARTTSSRGPAGRLTRSTARS